MNENSLKLHKKSKIICSCVCFIIVFSLFVISAVAIDNVYVTSPVRPSIDNVFDVPNYTYIGVGNTLYFDVEGYINLGEFGPYDVDRLTISLNEPNQDLGSFEINLWGTINDTYTSIRLVYVSVYGQGSTDFFYSPLTVSDFAFTGDFDDQTYAILDYFFEVADTPYNGNPWFDILQAVVDALSVDIFGYFSLWDIFTSLLGITVVVWLLKMLAGG